MNLINIWHNRKLVLGMNKRNLYYIRRFNKTKAKKIADNKILTKKYLTKNDIPTPQLIAKIKTAKDLRSFDFDQLPGSFVVKPVSGLEGGGIEIFYNRDKKGDWIRADGSRVSVDALYRHCLEIINGRFSLHAEPDSVLIEERVKPHKVFKYYSYKGTPDIRVLVYNNIPIMSYVRLPTKESRGKANLALGALGVGIDIARGYTTTAIKGKSGAIEFVPGMKLRLSGLRIPYWNKILAYAIQAQMATNLKFAAVDFLIDRDKGPMIVEINARPGLSIQLANDDGLRWRLRKAVGLKVNTVEKGIRLGKDLFGGEIDLGIANLSGKAVIGIYENIEIIGPNQKKVKTKAKIDTGADSTSIDKKMASQLGFDHIIELFENQGIPEEVTREEGKKIMHELCQNLVPQHEDLVDINLIHSSHGSSLRPYVNVTMKIQDVTFVTKVSIIDRSRLKLPVIVGRKSLSKFLVDPSKVTS